MHEIFIATGKISFRLLCFDLFFPLHTESSLGALNPPSQRVLNYRGEQDSSGFALKEHELCKSSISRRHCLVLFTDRPELAHSRCSVNRCWMSPWLSHPSRDRDLERQLKMDAESWGQTKRRAWMVRGQERQARMAWNQGGRRHPLGSPPSAPFPKGPGATHPFSQPLGFLPHQQVALPNSRPHLAVPGSM